MIKIKLATLSTFLLTGACSLMPEQPESSSLEVSAWSDERPARRPAMAAPTAERGNALNTASKIRLGMSRSAVARLLGQPEAVEHAGHPTYGNERWRYSFENTSERGFTLSRRVIYFEAGAVVGWETQ